MQEATRPNTPTSRSRVQEEPESTQTHHEPQPGIEKTQPKPVSKHTHPRPQPGAAKPNPKRGQHKPQPEVAGQSRYLSPKTRTLNPGQEWRSQLGTQTQTQTPHNNRKPSVHSPGTEAARAMQVTRPNEIRSSAVRLHPKACDALGLKAERETLNHVGTPVPRTCMVAHAGDPAK